MAITIPEKCYRQKNESHGVDNQGGETRDIILKGPYDALETLMDSLYADEVIEGFWLAESWNISRNSGNLGTLTIVCRKGEVGEDGNVSAYGTLAEDETWTLRSVRNDMSILGYCGNSGANPSRADIEAWQKEPDGSLAEELQYKKSDDSIHQIPLNSATAMVIDKIKAGIDSVMRFYPMLTKTRTFNTMPATVYANLATIDTPSISTAAEAKRLRKPGNLNAIIHAHTWLKCQDDLTLLPDGKFQRIESWMGVLPRADGTPGWDENLYGTGEKRWSQPLSA